MVLTRDSYGFNKVSYLFKQGCCDAAMIWLFSFCFCCDAAADSADCKQGEL
mgnify:CR=1 FL=1|jgi:hypothetical protein